MLTYAAPPQLKQRQRQTVRAAGAPEHATCKSLLAYADVCREALAARPLLILSLYSASIKPLLSLYQASIQPLLSLY